MTETYLVDIRLCTCHSGESLLDHERNLSEHVDLFDQTTIEDLNTELADIDFCTGLSLAIDSWTLPLKLD
jgi:hypothetical protein